MKILDYSPIPFDGGNLTFQMRMNGISRFGVKWVPEMKSQELVIASLNRALDVHFTLLRNVPIPGSKVIVPLVLFGLHGITVLNNNITKGLFRAEGDRWEVMDNRMKDFKTARPNLINRTENTTNAFKNFLTGIGFENEVDGILIFTDPGTHVNSNRPNVRIILMDAIERFAVSLMNRPQKMTMDQIRFLVEAITEALQPEEIRGEEDRIVPYQQFADNVDSGFLRALAPIQRKMNFSRPQWLLLAVIALLDIVVLIGFVIFILLTA
jgi:hypothetical protein